MIKRVLLYIFILGLLSGALAWQILHSPGYKNTSGGTDILPLSNRVFFSEPLRLRGSGSPGNTLTEEGVLAYTNKERLHLDIPHLQTNELLEQAAQKKLEDMFERQYFDHVAPDGTGPADLANMVGYEYITVGENLALGNFPSDKDLVQAWMDSPGHRENILSEKFQEIGIAVGRGMFEGEETWLAVQSFGTGALACPAPDSSLKSRVNVLSAAIHTLQNELNALDKEMQAQKINQESTSKSIDEKSAAGNEKIQKGNKKIEEGNRVYQETQSEEQAQPYWTEGKALQEEGSALISEANALITELQSIQSKLQQTTLTYNGKVKEINAKHDELAKHSEAYNKAAKRFNNCARKFTG